MIIDTFQTVTISGADFPMITPFSLDEYSSFIELLLTQQITGARYPFRIHSRPFIATLSSGEGVNSPKWGAKILGSMQPIQKCHSSSVDLSNQAFDVRQITRRIELYDLVFSYREQTGNAAGCIDLCLPPHRCATLLEILEHPRGSFMQGLLQSEFIREVIADICTDPLNSLALGSSSSRGIQILPLH